MPPNERESRQTIDQLLQAAGWHVQGPTAYPNLRRGRGTAVREVHLATGYADYLLFVDGRALGIIEAKRKGTPLTTAEPQSARYGAGLKQPLQAWRDDSILPFLYESTGVETFFTDLRDAAPRSRRVFAFHQPETLAEWVQQEQSLRGRFHDLPDLLTEKLWEPQVEAITNLEASLQENRPRALIQMATGSGKTFTAVNAVYRLVRYAGAKRILFLVDRSNLGRQAYKEFQSFSTPDDGRKFTELFNVRHLDNNHIPPHTEDVNRVYISTIQRIYAILRDEELEAEAEERSLYELEETGELPANKQPRTVSYTPNLPIEFFDLIIIDECHRSIYNLWRQVLEYFDAHLIGLTATPAQQTVAFFNENLVTQYDHTKAVADGINVAGEVYRIRTKLGEQGGEIAAGEFVTERNRLTRAERQRLLDEDFVYTGPQLGRQVISPSQLRLILRTFRDRLFREIFPHRTGEHVPKTLIFAKDDNHAEEIVRLVREEFGQGNDFCQKVTYKLEKGKKPDDIVSAFRNQYYPRIAVTVDMIATGTDVRPIECLLFLRMVRSRAYFMQMYGRGTRIISRDEMQAVTSDAPIKDHFVLVDAVGVTDEDMLVDVAPTLNRKRTVGLTDLLKEIAYSGASDEDTVATLASRLGRLQRKVNDADQEALRELCGHTLPELTGLLLHALDADAITDRARQHPLAPGPDESDEELAQELLAEAAAGLRQEAIEQFMGDAPDKLFEKLAELSQRTMIVYDEHNPDELLTAAYDEEATDRAQQIITDFRAFIEAHKDQITALRLIYNQQYDQQEVTFANLRQLAEAIAQPPHNWTTETLWRAYQKVGQAPQRPTSDLQALTNLVALVRHTLRPEDATLAPYPDLVQARYEAWLAEQAQAGRHFNEAQRWWLDELARAIGQNWGVAPRDLQTGAFAQRGGVYKARDVLGAEWQALIDEMNAALVVL